MSSQTPENPEFIDRTAETPAPMYGAATGVELVPDTTKPDVIPTTRAAWRAAAEQAAAQLWRFVRLFLAALIAQVIVQLSLSGGDVTLWSRKVWTALLVAAAEVAWRQFRPALTPSAADTAPGVTLVPLRPRDR